MENIQERYFIVFCLSSNSPVRYAKFQSIRYFIDIDIFQNSLIDIDNFKKVHIDIDFDIDIFKNDHVNINIDIFKTSLSIFLSISIFSKISYQYSFDIHILKRKVYISLIFQKMRYIDSRYRYFIIKA